MKTTNLKNPERERFRIAFGFLFPVSDSMVQKCWMAVKPLPDFDRAALIDDLIGAAAVKRHNRELWKRKAG